MRIKREPWRNYLTEEQRDALLMLEFKELEGITLLEEAKERAIPIIKAAKLQARAAKCKYELKECGRETESRVSNT